MAKYNEIYKSKMDWQNVFVRTGNFPLDRSSIFGSYEDAEKYAQGDGSDSRELGRTSYVGQIIAVYENNVVSIYKIVGEDVMDSENKTVEIKNRGLEELISRGDVHKLIDAAILSEDFEKQVKKIISGTSISSDLIFNFTETTQDIIANEEIKAEKVMTDEKINIIGTPLAQIINPDNSLDITISNATDLQAVLKMLLEKELYPENLVFTEGTINHVTPAPTITTNRTANAYYEVGTKCNFNAITATTIGYTTTDRKLTNIEYGYSLSNNNQKDYADTEIIKSPANKFVNDGVYKLTVDYTSFDNVSNNVVTANSVSNCVVEAHDATIKEGSNTITVRYEAPVVSATFNEIPKLYLCSNLQKTNENKIHAKHPQYVASAATKSSSSATFTVNGAWYLYAGGSNGAFEINSNNVRALGMQSMRTIGSSTITSTTACDNVIIAFPDKWGSLKSVKDNGSNTFITNNFGTAKSVTLKGANNYGSCAYKVYIYTPDNRLKNGFNYTITIG